jgi:hypothetical protein
MVIKVPEICEQVVTQVTKYFRQVVISFLVAVLSEAQNLLYQLAARVLYFV